MFKGIMRFFVDLYKVSMLSETSIHHYLHQLVVSPSEGCMEVFTDTVLLLGADIKNRV